MYSTFHRSLTTTLTILMQYRVSGILASLVSRFLGSAFLALRFRSSHDPFHNHCVCIMAYRLSPVLQAFVLPFLYQSLLLLLYRYVMLCSHEPLYELRCSSLNVSYHLTLSDCSFDEDASVTTGKQHDVVPLTYFSFSIAILVWIQCAATDSVETLVLAEARGRLQRTSANRRAVHSRLAWNAQFGDHKSSHRYQCSHANLEWQSGSFVSFFVTTHTTSRGQIQGIVSMTKVLRRRNDCGHTR